MLNAQEAEKLTLEVGVKVKSACDKALNRAVMKAIQEGKRKVDIALGYKECCEEDEHVAAYLRQSGYKDVEVTHDYPGYCESYEGKTFIKFNF